MTPKYMGIDFGLKQVGIAIGDLDSSIAFARPILKNDAQFFVNIIALCKEEQIKGIIVGLPLMLDNSESFTTKKSQEFIKHLSKKLEQEKLHITIQTFDERFTSTIAQQKMRDASYLQKQKKEKEDSIAAQVLLQNYFDSLKYH